MCVQSPERVAVDTPVATRDLGAVMCVHDGYSWDSCQDDGLLRSTVKLSSKTNSTAPSSLCRTESTPISEGIA